MKTSNKGFSLVELIIVIAIMAILAGALAPALIKYINKSRLSSDIQNANTIGTACQTALSSEAAYDAVTADPATYSSADFVPGDADKFKAAVGDVIGSKTLTVKAKKCMDGTSCTVGTYGSGNNFSVTISTSLNTVVVTDGASHTFFPTADPCLVN